MWKIKLFKRLTEYLIYELTLSAYTQKRENVSLVEFSLKNMAKWADFNLRVPTLFMIRIWWLTSQIITNCPNFNAFRVQSLYVKLVILCKYFHKWINLAWFGRLFRRMVHEKLWMKKKYEARYERYIVS